MKSWKHLWHKAKKHLRHVTFRPSLEEDINSSFEKHNIHTQFSLHESHPIVHLMHSGAFFEENAKKALIESGADLSKIDTEIALLKKIYLRRRRKLFHK